MAELVANLELEDLRNLTKEMVETIQLLIRQCNDEDIIFVPEDPEAYDDYASSDEEITMPWTLGHVIVHTTASAEEAAAVAAELARGVKGRSGRSRSEVDWREVTRIVQVEERLRESLRMRLAGLDMWPDSPHLDNTVPNFRREKLNAVGRYVSGLVHEEGHINQIKDIIQQARTHRS